MTAGRGGENLTTRREVELMTAGWGGVRLAAGRGG